MTVSVKSSNVLMSSEHFVVGRTSSVAWVALVGRSDVITDPSPEPGTVRTHAPAISGFATCYASPDWEDADTRRARSVACMELADLDLGLTAQELDTLGAAFKGQGTELVRHWLSLGESQALRAAVADSPTAAPRA